MILDEIIAYGHSNISCTHNTTIEITKDDYLTPTGTCILGIKASKACSNLSLILKKAILAEKKIKVVIEVDNFSDYFYGYGNKSLTLSHERDMVFRKSNYICNRTVLIKCTKAARDLDRNLIDALSKYDKKLKLKFIL